MSKLAWRESLAGFMHVVLHLSRAHWSVLQLDACLPLTRRDMVCWARACTCVAQHMTDGSGLASDIHTLWLNCTCGDCCHVCIGCHVTLRVHMKVYPGSIHM